jgi:hypothetical protein
VSRPDQLSVAASIARAFRLAIRLGAGE